MDNDRRINPRMPNKGIVKQSYLILKKNEKDITTSFNITNTSKDGIKGEIINPGTLKYDVEEGLPVVIKVTFNNNLTINIEGTIIWFKENPNNLEFGLSLSQNMW